MLDGLAHGSRSSMSGSQQAYTVSHLFPVARHSVSVQNNVHCMIIWWQMILYWTIANVWWFSETTSMVLTLTSAPLQFGGWSPQSYRGINLSTMKASCHIGPPYSLNDREHDFCNSLILSCWYILLKSSHALFFKELQLYVQTIRKKNRKFMWLCVKCGANLCWTWPAFLSNLFSCFSSSSGFL